MSEERAVSDVLVDRLIDWGAQVIFGLPGDHADEEHPE
jgi:thiamine pyrophosphate-dependent acetolactate synthase large subunit-like protein